MKRLFHVASATIVLALALSSCTPAASPTPATVPPSTTSPPPSNTPVPAAAPISPTETLPGPTPTAVPFELTSAAFEADALIPVRHACHGENLSPPLAWSEPPPGTQSFVLVMDDPDAVAVAGFVWDHWLLFNLPAGVFSMSEGVPADAELPDGSRQGLNSSGQLGFSGPCPPSGQTHGYVFTLYAADILLELEPGATKEDILQAIGGHILAQAQFVGLYNSP